MTIDEIRGEQLYHELLNMIDYINGNPWGSYSTNVGVVDLPNGKKVKVYINLELVQEDD
jgi:hypothetical protein